MSEQSESIAELAKALAKVQASLDAAAKSSSNPFFKSKYADLTTHLQIALPILSEHGIALIQMPCGDGVIARMKTMLVHTSGEYISSTDSMKPVKNTPQDFGSCDTYLRRYGLSIYGAYAADDDGNQASRKTQAVVTPIVKPVMTPDHKRFAALVKAYNDKGNAAIENALKQFSISADVLALIKQ